MAGPLRIKRNNEVTGSVVFTRQLIPFTSIEKRTLAPCTEFTPDYQLSGVTCAGDEGYKQRPATFSHAPPLNILMTATEQRVHGRRDVWGTERSCSNLLALNRQRQEDAPVALNSCLKHYFDACVQILHPLKRLVFVFFFNLVVKLPTSGFYCEAAANATCRFLPAPQRPQAAPLAFTDRYSSVTAAPL